MRETFDKVQVILDQAFGRTLAERIGTASVNAMAPRGVGSPSPPALDRF